MPFAPEITLSKFSLKGTASARGLSVSEWDGQALNGNVSGTANVRWGDTWIVDGVLTARNIYAAVFAPALLSEGRGEGSAKFSMRGERGAVALRNVTISAGQLNAGASADISQSGALSGRIVADVKVSSQVLRA